MPKGEAASPGWDLQKVSAVHIRVPPRGPSRNPARLAIILVLVALLLSTMATPALAQDPYHIKYVPTEQLPTRVEAGEMVHFRLRITNIGTQNFTGTKKLSVQLNSAGSTLASQQSIQLNKGAFTEIDLSFKADTEGTFEIKIEASAGPEYVEIWDASNNTNRVVGSLEVYVITEPFNWTPIIIAVVVVVVLVVVLYLWRSKTLKAEEEKRIAEDARRQEVIRKKEAEIAKKIEVRDVLGKHPRDYYIIRRQKFAHYKPSGMTSSGLTILKRERTKAELDAQVKHQCPKCGTVLPQERAICPRCTATEAIENVRHQIRHYKSREDVDFKDAEALLRKAEHRVNWSDWAGANEYVKQAETRMIEDWMVYKRGGHIEQTVTDKTMGSGPTKDAKIIGLEGEKQMTMVSLEGTIAGPDLGDEAHRGKPCPKCGRPMYEDICFYDEFEKASNACWALIEAGEADGAPLTEPKDLCRQATNAHEHGSDELAVRYLRRGYIVAKETNVSHARSKTEGIIKFTWALFEQVREMGEDVTIAKVMLEKAEASLKAGDNSQARSQAAKADGFLKQMREDGFRKRSTDLMAKVEAQPGMGAEAKALVEKARKLIAAKEYEGAVDLLEAARAKK